MFARVFYCSGPERHAWGDAADAARCCNGYRLVRGFEAEQDGTYRLVRSWEPATEAVNQPPRSAPVIDADPPINPNVPVRHMAFFRAASAETEGSMEYKTVLAGLLVLRLLDKWRSRVDGDRELKFHEFVAVKRAVEAIADSPVRRILGELVNTISAFTDGSADTRVPKLIAYAQLLEHDARYDVSADVYLTAIELASDTELLPLCYQRAGVCLRKLGSIGRAAELYREGLAVAAQHADQFWLLKLRISTALLELHTGDLPEAERQLDAIIADADAIGSPLAAEARHERGQVAYARDQDALAVEYFYAALKSFVDPEQKLRTMHDLATALADLGHLDYAKTVLSAIRNSTHAHAQVVNSAALNLMRIAVLAGEQVKFDQLRRELAGARLPGHQLAHYHVFVGQGYLKFGEPARAREEFAEALAVAQAHRVYKVLIDADELLKATTDVRAPTWQDPSPRLGLLVVLDEIRNRRGEFAEATE
jgi:tetratricopeptide (TPR) repeat protein